MEIWQLYCNHQLGQSIHQRKQWRHQIQPFWKILARKIQNQGNRWHQHCQSAEWLWMAQTQTTPLPNWNEAFDNWANLYPPGKKEVIGSD